MKPIEVGAGLVFHRGKLLITQRPSDAHLGGLWEFPGGKRHSNESFRECIIRELDEELGIDVAVHELIDSVQHRYPDKSVRIEFYRCSLTTDRPPRAIGCHDFAWIDRKELDRYEFPAADARLLENLSQRGDIWNLDQAGRS